MDIVQSMDDDAIKYKPNFDQIKDIEDKGKDLNHGNHCFNFESNFEVGTMYIGAFVFIVIWSFSDRVVNLASPV